MSKFNFESMMKAALPLIHEQVEPLKTPQNSVYYHLSVLQESDVIFQNEYVRVVSPTVEYKAKGCYQSTLEVEDKEREVIYSSSLEISPQVGVIISKSKHFDAIPEEYTNEVALYLEQEGLSTAAIKELVIKDAMPKLKAKVRRAKDPVELDNFSKFEVMESKIKRVTLQSIEWAKILRSDDQMELGYAYCRKGESPVYVFKPDTTKENLDHSIKTPENIEKEKQQILAAAEKEKKAQAPKSKPQKPKKKHSVGDVITTFFAQSILAVIVAAIILFLEFAVIFTINKGAILKSDPGIYEITTENFEEILVLSTNQKIEIGQKQTYVPAHNGAYAANAYPLFKMTPRYSSIHLFDLKEKNATSTRLHDDPKHPRFQISDLTVTFEITYSYQGQVHTVTATKHVDNFESYMDAEILVSLPENSITSYTTEFITGEETRYKSELDYWSVTVIEASGIAEIEEVN